MKPRPSPTPALQALLDQDAAAGVDVMAIESAPSEPSTYSEPFAFEPFEEPDPEPPVAVVEEEEPARRPPPRRTPADTGPVSTPNLDAWRAEQVRGDRP